MERNSEKVGFYNKLENVLRGGKGMGMEVGVDELRAVKYFQKLLVVSLLRTLWIMRSEKTIWDLSRMKEDQDYRW